MPSAQSTFRQFLKSSASGAVYTEALQAQTFRDLLDHLYERFQRPALIISRNRKGGFSSFFPRKGPGKSEEFFEYLLAISAEARAQGRIELIELERVRLILEAELRGENSGPQWQPFVNGILDLYVPIHASRNSSEPATAILVFGKFCGNGGECTAALYSWIEGLTKGVQGVDILPSVRPDTRRRQIQHLRLLAERLPVLTEATKVSLEAEVLRAVRLMEKFLRRISTAGRSFRQESLVDRIVLEEPTIDVTEVALWNQLRKTLQTVVEELDVTTAAVYFADYRDYTSLNRVASFTRGREPREILQFPSLDNFRKIDENHWLGLPADQDLAWLRPQDLLGTNHAILFARELRISHLVVIAVGMTSQQRLDPTAKASLWDLVNSKLFPHIERAFAAIDLDQLLGEAGHLLGRSVGTVKSAAESLRDILCEIVPPGQLGDSEREFRVADWALEAGVMKLELIRQNFYQLAHPPPRGGIDARSEADDDGVASLKCVDVLVMINDLKRVFETEAKREGRFVRYSLDILRAPVRAQEEALKTVILNLWDNAVKFSYNHTVITISLKIVGDQVLFSIEDVGLGVPFDEKRAVFRPRFKSRLIDEASSRQKQGLGLGLAYCRRKIEHDFGGVIELESRPEKRREGERFEGDAWTTTVIFSLPVASGDGDKSKGEGGHNAHTVL